MILVAIVVSIGCDGPRAERIVAEPPKPPRAYVKPPASHPTAQALRAAHNRDVIPEDFRALWDEAIGGNPTSRHSDYFYHVVASGDRGAAILVPWNHQGNPAILPGHSIHVLNEAFAFNESRISRREGRTVSTPYGAATAFDESGYTFYRVTIRSERYPPGNRPRSLTVLVWRERHAN